MKKNVITDGNFTPEEKGIESFEIDEAAKRLLSIMEMFELSSGTIRDVFGNSVIIKRDKHGFFNTKITRESYITNTEK